MITEAVSQAIGSGIKGITSLVKGIQGNKMRKAGEADMNKAIADIKYSRPDEYGQIMNILGQRSGRLKTQERMVGDNIKSSTASGISDIRQLADSPVAALGAYGGLKDREMNAIKDVGVQFQGMQDQALLDQGEGLKMGADYSEKEQYYNQIYKNMIKANMGASKMEAGRNMAWDGAEGFVSAGLDFLGTKYLSDKMNPSDPTTDASLANL